MRCKYWIAIGCCWFLPVLPVHSQEPLRLGVFPFVPATAIESGFGPLAQALHQHLQRPVVVKTRKTFDTFFQSLQNQEFDIALVQPFDYIRLRDQSPYLPLVRKVGLLNAHIVSGDEMVKNLQDLRQQIVAFPSRNAAVSLLAIRDLQRAGLTAKDYQALFLDDHSSCLLAVANGQAIACATVGDLPSYDRSPIKIHTVHETESIAHILFVIMPGAVDQLEDLRQWFLSLNDNETGRVILRRALLNEVVTALPEDYDSAAKIYQEIQLAKRYSED